MATVDMDSSNQFLADSQPKSIFLIWGLAATRHSVCIHQMNYGFCHDDSTINIVVVIIIVIIIIFPVPSLRPAPRHLSP